MLEFGILGPLVVRGDAGEMRVAGARRRAFVSGAPRGPSVQSVTLQAAAVNGGGSRRRGGRVIHAAHAVTPSYNKRHRSLASNTGAPRSVRHMPARQLCQRLAVPLRM